MDDRSPIIQFRGVKKAFGDNVIYTGLDLDIYKGETISIIGGSGTGKSVMLKMIIGLMDPDEGEISVDGRSVVGLSEEDYLPVRKKVSMLFQGGALFDSMTVGDNIAFPLKEAGMRDEARLREIIDEKLEMVGLSPKNADLMPQELSGGMRKRAALARAIATEPEVILYDEPTTGLDPINCSRISMLIMRLKERLAITSIVVTHEMRLVFDVSDRIAMLYDKRFLTVGTPDEIRSHPAQEVKDFVEGAFPGFDE